MTRRLFNGFMILFLICTLGMPGMTAHAEKRPKLVILLVNNIDWSDLNQAQTPHLRNLIKNGALGWINVKNYRGFFPSSSYLTIGMSNRTKLDDKTGLAFSVNEQVPGFSGVTGGQYFTQFTGIKTSSKGIVVPDLAKIKLMAAEVDPLATPGFLGQLLKDKDRQVALFGNADIPGQLHREAALMFMDTSGRIPMGSVGPELLIQDPTTPFGWRTDYSQILSQIKNVSDKADIIAVETGDTSRIESGVEMFTPHSLTRARQKALKFLDPFIGGIISEIHPDNILLFSVNPNTEMIKAGNTGLAPIILFGQGPGLLASSSTQRAGYVTNLDLAASICDLAGITQNELGKGFSFRVEHSPVGIKHLINEGNYFSALRSARYPVNNGMVFLFIAVILIGIFAVRFKFAPRWSHIFQWIIGTLIVLPLGVLVGSIAGYSPVWPALVITFGVASGISFILLQLLPTRQALIVMFLAVPLVILLDTFLGGQWMLHSTMGSDLIAGGRFYGMGNDLMGVVVGCLIAAIGLLTQEFPAARRSAPYWASFLFILALAGIGLPMFGANVGGTIVGFVAGTLSVLVLCNLRISWRKLLIIFISAVVVTVLVASADAFFNPHPTHAGRAILLLIHNGSAGFIQIVTIKLQILFGTIGGSMYSWLFLAELLTFLILKFVQPTFLPNLRQEYPYWHRMMKTLGITCFLAVTVKDTGIIAAAFIFSYYWLTAYSLKLGEEHSTSINQEGTVKVTG